MRILRDESGAVLVEYALVLALLSFAFIGGMIFIESTVSNTLFYVQQEFQNYGLRNNS